MLPAGPAGIIAAMSLPTHPAGAAARLDLLPTPQCVERLDFDLALTAAPVLATVQDDSHPHVRLAAELLGEQAGGLTVELVPYPSPHAGRFPINPADEAALTRHHGQGYVLRTMPDGTVAIAGRPLGLLYGAQTLIQLLEHSRPAGRLGGVYIRDFPDFRWRAAACWLLNGEANRWTHDRGQGLDAYESLVRRKLDQCLRYKINMVVFDGFGFGLGERFGEYPSLMRRLNSFARERGIHLVFGGYGAGFGMAYQPGPLYEDAPYLGTVFRNRDSYPDGRVYACMGYPRTRDGLEPGEFGMCRSNDSLNRLKAEELRAFVRAVEPGALYIHHEDFGGMDTTQTYWLKRCPACHRRWPNDDARAADGAAGAIAHGYRCLVEAVNSVRNSESGYDASRDCVIILTSPVYMPSSPSSNDWERALRLWQNVAVALPPAENLACCFRETFPQPGGARWADAFNQAMADVDARLGLWVYFAGGADHWLNDYPLVATPAMNVMFQGAAGIYSACGDGYQEPQQLLNAEYAWNCRSDGFRVEERNWDDANRTWQQLAMADLKPAAIFGDGGWLDRICRRLYGPAAGPLMREHVTRWDPLAPPEQAQSVAAFDAVAGASESKPYLPMAYAKVFGVPVHWRRLALDSKTWGRQIANEVYARKFEACEISRAQLHARLGRQWELIHARCAASLKLVEQALGADLPAATRDDLMFLRLGLEVSLPLSRSLGRFHSARQSHFEPSADRAACIIDLDQADRLAGQAAELADRYFPVVTDPCGAEVGAVKTALAKLRGAIADARSGQDK